MQHINVNGKGSTNTLIHSSTQHDLSEKRIRGIELKYLHYKGWWEFYEAETKTKSTASKLSVVRLQTTYDLSPRSRRAS